MANKCELQMEGKYDDIPCCKGKAHLHLFVIFSHDGIKMENGNLMQIKHRCNLCHVSKFQFGFPHSDSQSSLCNGKTSPCAIDGLFQQINMLGNNFQVLALSSSFLLLRLNMFIGIYLFSFDQSCSAQVSCLTVIRTA